MNQLKEIKLRRLLLLLLSVSICFACYSTNRNNTAFSQDVKNESAVKKIKNDREKLIGKAYIENLDKESIIEFKSIIDENGIETLSVYLNQIKKGSFEDVAHPQILADFNDNFYGRLFILAIASPASGSCGNSSFAIVSIIEKTDEIKMSKPSKIECQGEIQDIRIETIDNSKIIRQLTIDKLKFNLESFEWVDSETKVKIK